MAAEALDFVTKSPEETQRLGEALGGLLRPGDVLALTGELGAGKTTFIQGLAKGLGVNPEEVRSPTFILLREYPGRVPLIHIDAYRLEDAPSAVWLDVEWLFSPRKVTAIEWAEHVADCLPEDYLELRLSHKSTQQRQLRVIAHGPRSREIAAAWAEAAAGAARSAD
jgi:tRNA threonylcarbamoyladenosine biosynthesis protein TsaE